jgi:hypothetical protein
MAGLLPNEQGYLAKLHEINSGIEGLDHLNNDRAERVYQFSLLDQNFTDILFLAVIGQENDGIAHDIDVLGFQTISLELAQLLSVTFARLEIDSLRQTYPNERIGLETPAHPTTNDRLESIWMNALGIVEQYDYKPLSDALREEISMTGRRYGLIDEDLNLDVDEDELAILKLIAKMSGVDEGLRNFEMTRVRILDFLSRKILQAK